MDQAELERIAAEERRAYHRAWRAANRDKTAEHRRHYWEKKALERYKTSEGEVSGNDRNKK